MARLTDQEQQEIIRFIEADKPLPDKYRFLLFEDVLSHEYGPLEAGQSRRKACSTWGPRIGRNASKGFESSGTAAEKER